MLPKHQRLAKSKEIKKIISEGICLKTPHISIYFHPAPSEVSFSRTATIVSKKVSLSAVVRHKYQRWLRENAKLIIGNLKQPLDMVWIARPSIKEVKSFTSLVDSTAPFVDNIK